MAELGWMAMGIVDTIMVGSLGPSAISAVGVAVSIQMAITIFGMGVLLGLDTLVSQAFGARKIDECHRWLFDGIVLAAMLTVPTMILSGFLWLAIPHMGFHPDVTPLLVSYFSILLWSTVPLLFYAACRRYLQGMHHPTPVMLALVTANVLNAAANYALIHGHWGLPALGIQGSAWATVIARLFMLAVVAVAIWRYRDTGHFVFPVDFTRVRRLVSLGFPAASQITAEVGVFALATMLAGMLDPISSASHQCALNLAGVAFMIPLGLSSAGAVRVGHAVGAGDPHRAAASGWMSILLTVAVMIASGLLFLLVPRQLIGIFTRDESVLALGSSLLYIAAIFQLFDGVQGVVTGTLRGIGDTRTPMLVNLGAHWLLGLPVSYSLCFWFGYGVRGLWIGLSIGLIVTGLILIYVWTQKIHRYRMTGMLHP